MALANKVLGRFKWQTIASALLILASFPPFRLGLLVFVALVPWLIYLSSTTPKQAWKSGYLFGFIFWLGELYFILSLASNWTGSTALAIVPYLLGCSFAALYFAIFGWLAQVCFRNNLPWMIPVVWAGVEVFRSYIVVFAFPFGQLASPLAFAPVLIQGAHFGTIFLVSAWVAAVNLVVAMFIQGKPYREMRWLTLICIAVLAGSIAWYGRPIEGTEKRVVAGQTGIDVAFGEQEGIEYRIANNVNQIEEQSRGADLLVLPEGLIRAGSIYPPKILFKADPALPMIFGGQRGENPTYQSAFGFDGSWRHADKTRLVVFGEYVPGRNWIPFLDKFKLPVGDLQTADVVKSVKVGDFTVGAMLCFEGLFPDVAYKQALNGSNVIAVMAIDDWYFGTNAPEQLRDGSTWRAVETGLPVIRAASLGYTTIIDQRGRTVAEAPLRETKALGATIKVSDTPQYSPFLPIFPYLSLASIFLVPLYDWIKKRRGEVNSTDERAEGESKGPT